MQSYMRSILQKVCKINKHNMRFTYLYSTDSECTCVPKLKVIEFSSNQHLMNF